MTGPAVPIFGQQGTRHALPAGFLFGTSTAAYQIEGRSGAGQGVSIWDTFSHTPGSTRNGDTGDVACRHLTRWKDDLDLMADLGVGAYRFSASWTRVQPDGKGPASQEGLDFYRRLVDGLRERDIVPVLTLYHWDMPQPLQDAGGWPARDTASRFADYAAIVARALGDRVGYWITVNEPWCAAWLGYGSGQHAPGARDLGLAAAAHHHLLVGHAGALAAVRANCPGAQAGISLNLQPVRPATDHPSDVAAALRVDGQRNRLFLDPLTVGSYPDDMLAHYAGHHPGFGVIADGDLAAISAPADFLGVNYYSPATVADESRRAAAAAAGFCVAAAEPDVLARDLRAIEVTRPGVPKTAMGWPVEPGALTELLVRVHRDWPAIPLVVTENGAACDDYAGPDGVIRDPERIRYLDGHVRAVLRAREAGADVRGYFVWSLLDNFEWAYGYSKRFGLVWVDFPTGARVPKDSFRWYQRVLKDGFLPPDRES